MYALSLQINKMTKRGVVRPSEAHVATYMQSLNHLATLPLDVYSAMRRELNSSWTRPSYILEKASIKEYLTSHVASSWEQAVASKPYSAFLKRRMPAAANPVTLLQASHAAVVAYSVQMAPKLASEQLDEDWDEEDEEDLPEHGSLLKDDGDANALSPFHIFIEPLK
jgi:hypothetical protein